MQYISLFKRSLQEDANIGQFDLGCLMVLPLRLSIGLLDTAVLKVLITTGKFQAMGIGTTLFDC